MTRATAKYYPSLGSVSEGTLRTEDLLDTFAYELCYHIKRMRLTREQRKRMRQLIKDATDCAPDNDGEGGVEFYVDMLHEALNEIAPPYAYFGASEGDGASFGFGPCLGMNGDTDDLPKLPAGDAIRKHHWGEDVLLVNDHGNVDCGYVDKRGRFHAYWSIV